MSPLWKPIEKYIRTLNGSGSVLVAHHYTNISGALGILKSGRIWFTERAHLNDPSEISHGVETAKAILKEQGREEDASRLDVCTQKIFRDFLFFSASFSRKSDDLYQWNNYADDGHGVILSFKFSAFSSPEIYIDKFIPNNPTAIVCPMSYNSADLRLVITDIINEWNGANIEDLCDHVLIISGMFKNDCWKHEEEYRFFVHGRRQSILKSNYLKFRKQNGKTISYLDIPIQNWDSVDDFPINRICLGPAASSDIDVQLGNFLSSKNIPNPATALSRSALPYRSLRSI